MKDNRILIYSDRAASEKLERNVNEVAEACNSVVEIFESFQEWKKITTHSEWLELVGDPGEYFDEVLLSNVNMSAGGRKPDPETAAKLFSVDRENYLSMVAGKRIVDPECKPCQKMKIRKGTSAISINNYQQFESLLLFNSGHFTINEETITLKQEEFKIYLQTEKQHKYYDHFVSLAKILNEHIEINKLGTAQIDQLKSITGLLILNGKLIIDEIKMSTAIKYMK